MPMQGAEIHIGGSTYSLKRQCTIRSGVRTGYLIGGAGSTANAIFADLADDFQLNQSASDAYRKGIFLDLGGGVRYVTIDVFGYEGNSEQWGSSTGADPFTQMDDLINAIASNQIDSRNPATLEYGEHYSGGNYGAMDVVFEEPNLEIDAEEHARFAGTITCLNAVDVNDVWDSVTRLG